MPAAISFQNVSKNYATPRGELQALQGVSFDIEPGEFFGLLGRHVRPQRVADRRLQRQQPRQDGIRVERVVHRHRGSGGGGGRAWYTAASEGP